MSHAKRILLLADQPVRQWLIGLFDEGLFEVTSTSTGREGKALLTDVHPSLVITELTLSDMDGFEVLQAVKDTNAGIPVIVLTSGEEFSMVVEAMDLGAYACIKRPADTCKVRQMVFRALRMGDTLRGIPQVKHERRNQPDPSHLVIGKACGMAEIHQKIRFISSRRRSALIQGEEGTGKALVSRAIHDCGVTRGHPFVAVDFPTLPDPLIEKVIFGESLKPQSNQAKDRKGLFEIAGEGTLLLNGISEISPNLQEKLLNVLSEKEFRPVGKDGTVPVKSRVLASTDKDLGELVRAGRFREDLFYRIADSVIDIPPLRERKSDIPRLVVHFLRKINKDSNKSVKRIPGETIGFLKEYDWPGNVAELESVLTRAVLAAEGDILEKKYLESQWDEGRSSPVEPRKPCLNSEERDHIRLILEETNWDKREAARLLNISRQTLYNKIKMYGILPT